MIMWTNKKNISTFFFLEEKTALSGAMYGLLANYK